ncbi:MAG: hypothetical protein AAGD07_04620 [Planctomycetota bacterium]
MDGFDHDKTVACKDSVIADALREIAFRGGTVARCALRLMLRRASWLVGQNLVSSVRWPACTLAILLAATLTPPLAAAGDGAVIRRWGRVLGVGWSNGYHADHQGPLRPLADLPPRNLSRRAAPYQAAPHVSHHHEGYRNVPAYGMQPSTSAFQTQASEVESVLQRAAEPTPAPAPSRLPLPSPSSSDDLLLPQSDALESDGANKEDWQQGFQTESAPDNGEDLLSPNQKGWEEIPSGVPLPLPMPAVEPSEANTLLPNGDAQQDTRSDHDDRLLDQGDLLLDGSGESDAFIPRQRDSSIVPPLADTSLLDTAPNAALTPSIQAPALQQPSKPGTVPSVESEALTPPEPQAMDDGAGLLINPKDPLYDWPPVMPGKSNTTDVDQVPSEDAAPALPMPKPDSAEMEFDVASEPSLEVAQKPRPSGTSERHFIRQPR